MGGSAVVEVGRTSTCFKEDDGSSSVTGAAIAAGGG
jgi:hypothetical protein